MQRRVGRTFIVDFKPTGEYLNPQGAGPAYNLGLVTIYPEGIGVIKVQDAQFIGGRTPTIKDQLYYLKWVDAMPRFRGKGYKLTSSGKEGKDVFLNAEIRTGGFILKAPKVRIRETESFIKITILEKIRTPNGTRH